MPDFSNAEQKVEDTFHTVEEDVEEYFFGDANKTHHSSGDPAGSSSSIYPEDAYENTDCDYLMKPEITKYWGTVGAMFALFILAFVIPYFLCCCNRRWPRCAAKWYCWIGMAQWIVGALLATSVLMPDCLNELCGDDFCSAHKYNPGQVWGGVVIGLGFLLQCKACAQWRYAKSKESESNLAAEAEKGALVSTIDTMMEDSQRGSYKDKPIQEETTDFPDQLL